MWVLLDPFFFFLISFLMLHLVLRPRSQTKYELEDQIIKFFASCHFASFCHHLIPVFYIKGNACLCIFVLSVTGKCCCCSPACWDLICSKSLLSANSSNGSLFLWSSQIHLWGPEEYLYLTLWRRPAALTGGRSVMAQHQSTQLVPNTQQSMFQDGRTVPECH